MSCSGQLLPCFELLTCLQAAEKTAQQIPLLEQDRAQMLQQQEQTSQLNQVLQLQRTQAESQVQLLTDELASIRAAQTVT